MNSGKSKDQLNTILNMKKNSLTKVQTIFD